MVLARGPGHAAALIRAERQRGDVRRGHNRGVIDPQDAPLFDGRALNELAQLATRDGRVIGVAYAVATWVESQESDRTYEFWWLPVHDPDREEVLFGYAAGPDGGVVSWDGVHRAAQWIEAEHDRAARN